MNDDLDSSALACDRCDGSLLANEDVRYQVEIVVKAAYDPLELDLDAVAAADVGGELERLRRVIDAKSADELEAEVYKRLTFDLCPPCQRAFLADPLGAKAARSVGGSGT